MLYSKLSLSACFPPCRSSNPSAFWMLFMIKPETVEPSAYSCSMQSCSLRRHLSMRAIYSMLDTLRDKKLTKLFFKRPG